MLKETAKEILKKSHYTICIPKDEAYSILSNLPYELIEDKPIENGYIIKYHVFFNWRGWHYYLKIKILQEENTKVESIFYEDVNNSHLSMINHYFNEEKEFFDSVKKRLKPYIISKKM